MDTNKHTDNNEQQEIIHTHTQQKLNNN